MNRTIFTGDCLDVLRGMNSDTADLIYLDPPFNSKKEYHGAIGSDAEGTSFDDVWHWSRLDESDTQELAVLHPGVAGLVRTASDVHGKGMASYLVFMGLRLIELKRVLKDTGSIWLHCDDTAGSYLKVLMDAVFGQANFRNAVAWHYYNKYAAGKKVFGRNYDRLLFFSGGNNYNFTPLREKRDKPRRQLVRENVNGILKNKRDSDGRLMYRISHDRKVDSVWRIPCLQHASPERVGYATQKPLALLRRIIEASSNPGDLVLDPFCGCATTCVAADELDRKWIGIDELPEAMDLVVQRLRDTGSDNFGNVSHRKTPPVRTDRDPEIRNKTKLKNYLVARDGCKCAYCHRALALEFLDVDHVVPKRRGGPDHQDNRKLACRKCNNRKGTKSEIEYLRELERDRLQASLNI